MNKKHLLIGSIMTLGMLVSSTALAEDVSTQIEATSNTAGAPTAVPVNGSMPKRPLKEIREGRQELRDTRQDKKAELRDDHQENKKEVEDLKKENHEDTKSTLEALRLELTEKVKAGTITKEEAYKTFNDAAKAAREANKEEIKNTREENRDEMKTKREDVKKDLKDKKAELKNELHQKMQARFSAMTERFTKISDRMQSRIDKLTVDGKDMSSAQTALNTAITDIAALDTLTKNAVIKEGTDEATMTANKATLDAIKEAMKKVQKDLATALALIK